MSTNAPTADRRVEWQTTRLLDVTRHHSGNGKLIKGKLSDAPRDGLFPAYSASGQDVWRDAFEHEGDAIIVSAVGARCGKCFLASGKWSAVANTHVVWPDAEKIDRKFLWYRVNDERFWERSGSAQPFVVVRKTFERYCLLPPILEQRRIVAEIEKQFSRLEAGVAALRRVQANLKRYRAAVLKAACEGQLVPTEAELHRQRKTTSAKLDTGAELLTRILAERRKNWLARRSLGEGGTGRGQYKEPAAPDTANLPTLPEGWTWATVEQISSWLAGSIQSGPFGSHLLHSEFVDRGILAIGIDNVRDGSFSIGANHRITKEKFKQLEKFAARPRDVLVTVMATVGRVCVLPDDLETSIVTKHCYRITPSHTGVNSRFLSQCLRADFATRQYLFGNIRGQTRAGINGAILKLAPVPLPPLAEQTRIVSEVDRRLSMVEELESVVSANLQRSTRLRQSILQKAFTGGLP